MGTETHEHNLHFRITQFLRVKLNNPQMGTETRYINPTHYGNSWTSVKLNNPQMGTETLSQLSP